MELSEKIQKLRKEHNLTQEQLAERLFVSRTAVSKWETGRGVPSVESLQQLGKLFHISLDELLSTDEVVVIAEREKKEDSKRFGARLVGVMNVMGLLGLLLPLYKVETKGFYASVPLYQLGGWQEPVFFAVALIMVICGTASLVLLGREREAWVSRLNTVGTVVHIIAILLLIVCGQPYPAVLYFVLFMGKGVPFLKNHP